MICDVRNARIMFCDVRNELCLVVYVMHELCFVMFVVHELFLIDCFDLCVVVVVYLLFDVFFSQYSEPSLPRYARTTLGRAIFRAIFIPSTGTWQTPPQS
jgi:hypothetical protein